MFSYFNKQDKKTWLMAGVIIVVAVLAMVLITSNVQKKRGLRDALVRAQEAVSAHVRAEYVMHLPKKLRKVQRPFTEVAVTIEGDLGKGEETGVMTGTLSGELTGPGNVFFFDGELRVLSDKVAFNLSQFPVLLNPRQNLVNKWTYIDAKLLPTKNVENIQSAMTDVLKTFSYAGKVKNEAGKTLWSYTASLNPEQEQALVDAMRLSASGNQAWHVAARLLNANDSRNVTLLVNPTKKTLAGIEADFVRPLANGTEAQVATLKLFFTDYNKSITVDRPEQQATVRPDVFAKLLGSGEVSAVQLGQ